MLIVPDEFTLYTIPNVGTEMYVLPAVSRTAAKGCGKYALVAALGCAPPPATVLMVFTACPATLKVLARIKIARLAIRRILILLIGLSPVASAVVWHTLSLPGFKPHTDYSRGERCKSLRTFA